MRQCARASYLSCIVTAAVLALAASHSEVAAFYYLWYRNQEYDGRYAHWDHSVLPHWTEAVRRRFPNASFVAPDDIHAPYYPERGLYSSADPEVLRSHMQQMKAAGVGVAVASWWGRAEVSTGDSQGILTDATFPALLDSAASAGVQVSFHLEPYEGRTAASIRADLRYLHERYGHHPALLRVNRLRRDPAAPARCVPVYYVYDSYHISTADWTALISDARGDPALDGFFIGLWLEASHGDELASAGFDGG